MYAIRSYYDHVSTHDIVAANIIDRATYIIYLGILFLVALGLHARNKLSLRSLRKLEPQSDDKEKEPSHHS